MLFKNTIKLSNILQRENNNFDIIRLFAAIMVILGHSFHLFPTNGFKDPVQIVTKYYSGTLAVAIFFFISGILITQSYFQTKSAIRFTVMRLSRIYPGALFCLFFVSLILGPLVTTLSLSAYLTSAGPYCYMRDNWSFTNLFWFWSPGCFTLPGVFEKNIYAGAINGSLWTLFPELVCYSYVLVIGMLGGLNTNFRIITIILLILTIHAISPQLVPYFSEGSDSNNIKVALSFLAGVLAFALRDWLTLRWIYLVPLIFETVMFRGSNYQELPLYFTIFYFILLINSTKWLRGIKLPGGGDYSFGVYIYAWPIQQTAAHFWPNLTSYPSNLICIPLALLAGYASWHLIEHPALTAAHRFTTKNRPT